MQHAESTCVISPNGDKEWLTAKGKRHCLDGPALEYAGGATYWFLNGELHPEDGPAVQWADGSKEWWINGQRN